MTAPSPPPRRRARARARAPATCGVPTRRLPLCALSYDRYSHLAMGAAKDALADGGLALAEGGLDKDAVDPKRFGVLIGACCGGIQAVETSTRILTANDTSVSECEERARPIKTHTLQLRPWQKSLSVRRM